MKWISDSKSIRQLEKKHNERKAELKELVDSLFDEEPSNSVEHLASSGALAGVSYGNSLQALTGAQRFGLCGIGQAQANQQMIAAQSQLAAQQQSMQFGSGLGNITGLGASLFGGTL
jgi:hypothetical protein